MSLTSVSSDACTMRQAAADTQNVYAATMNPIQNFRPTPGPQSAGVIVDRMGNAQSQVDLESMLRNQSFVSSACPAYRLAADQCLKPYMADKPLQCASRALMPQVQYHSRACEPVQQIDRFEPLIAPMVGQANAYIYAGQNTKADFKDQLARSRNAYM